MIALRLRLVVLEARRFSMHVWESLLIPRLPLVDGEEISLHSSLWHFAVPKKRVSKSRKRIKNAHIGPKKITHIAECPDCGEFRKFHHLWECCVQKAMEKTAQAKKHLLAKVKNTTGHTPKSSSSPNI
mmetsp:Transcript_21181/g.27428  ORF Transcript_21181/g.27428 Transcript_21181/m.27428 type:complete len:128 (+) Transcript_21181:43-426(+)